LFLMTDMELLHHKDPLTTTPGHLHMPLIITTRRTEAVTGVDTGEGAGAEVGVGVVS